MITPLVTVTCLPPPPLMLRRVVCWPSLGPPTDGSIIIDAGPEQLDSRYEVEGGLERARDVLAYIGAWHEYQFRQIARFGAEVDGEWYVPPWVMGEGLED